MADWRERRGLTLRLRASGDGARFVRLSLVERAGLLGSWFNVREARAELVDHTHQGPQSLGGGRFLAWRPLSHGDAQSLIAERGRTLERLGYKIIQASESEREPWAWLHDLVHRQLETGEPDAPIPETQDVATSAELPSPVHTSTLVEHALALLEDDSDSLLTGLAEVLGLDRESFESPTPAVLARVDATPLGRVLHELIESQSVELREVARRWLAMPTTVYELDQVIVEGWLELGRDFARQLAPRLPVEGLAILGPQALDRLSRKSRSPRVRQFAAHWGTRTRT